MSRATLSPGRLGVIFAVVWLGANRNFSAIPPAEKLLPMDTLVVASTPDARKLRDSFERSAPYRFWNDAAMKPFRDKFMNRWNEELLAPLERDLGVTISNYTSLLQGQVTFALTQNGWTGQDHDDNRPGILLLLDAGAKSDQLQTNLAGLRKRWTDAGKAVKMEKIRDLEFTIVHLSSNDVPRSLGGFLPKRQEVQELGKAPENQTEPPRTLVFGQFESLFIAGNSAKLVENVVAHLTGGGTPSLADDPVFEQNRLALFREAGAYAWLNAKALVDLVLKWPTEKPNPEAPNPAPLPELHRLIAGLGLTGLSTASLTFHDTGDGTLIKLFFQSPDASRDGLFRLLSVEPKEAGPPPFVPADVLKFRRFRLDGQKTVAGFEKMLKMISPQFYNSWDFLLRSGEEAMKQNDPNYDLRKYIIANLGDDFFTYERPPHGNSLAELNSPPSLLAMASPDAELLARALGGLLILRTGDALTPKVREFLGKKIYSVGLPSATAGVNDAMHYTASNGYLLLSTDPATLEEFLRSAETPGKPLRDIPGLAEVAQRVGGFSTGMFSYENQAETTRLAFEMLKKLAGGAAPLPVTPGAISISETVPFAGPDKSFRDWMDFSLLPDFSKVAKYFSYSVWSGGANVEGLGYQWFSPTPPGMK